MTLFKYVVPERVDILERELVRFTHPSALNDLSELRPAFSHLVTPAETKKHLEDSPFDPKVIAQRACERLTSGLRATVPLAELEQVISEQLASAAELDVLTNDALDIVNSLAPTLRGQMYEALDKLVGVFSLSETWDNGPMWAHYAANHSGFVIGLDNTHPFFNRRSANDEYYHLRKVSYIDAPRGQRSFRDIAEAASIFFTKESRWAYEQEHRMLAPLADAAVTTGPQHDQIHLFSIPPEAIERVIFGARAVAELVKKIHHVVSKAESPMAHVQLLRISADDDRGGLKLMPALAQG